MSIQYTSLKWTSRLICLLPYPAVLKLGKLLGHIYYHAAARQRRRALEQMQESLGLPREEAARIIRSLFDKLGQTFVEVLYMPALTKENIKQYITMENAEYLHEAVKQGNGVVLLTAHVGNWEWLGARLAMEGLPLTTVIKRQPNDQHTQILNEYRQMVGIEVFARGTTELVGAAKALKQGKVLGFLADQDGGHEGIFVSFLGKMASTPKGPAVFARKFKCPVIPCFIVRRPEGSGHRVLVYPPVKVEERATEEETLRELTRAMAAVTENVIKEHPDEWMWFQKRWNTPYTPDFPATAARGHGKAGEAL